MARTYEHERVAELRAEGRGTWEINRIITRERLEYEIEDIEHIEDMKSVLRKLLERINF